MADREKQARRAEALADFAKDFHWIQDLVACGYKPACLVEKRILLGIAKAAQLLEIEGTKPI